MAADVEVLFDNDDGCALIAHHDRRAQSGRSGAGNHDIRGAIPLCDALGSCLVLRSDADDRGGADAERAFRDEFSSACPEPRRAPRPELRHFTVTSTSKVEKVWPSLAIARSRYAPGVEKRTLVSSV